MRNRALAVIAAMCALGAGRETPPVPLGSGEYQFEMKDFEFPTLPSTSVRVILQGRHIKVVSDSRESTLFPYGTAIDEGLVIWHAASGQWIIGHNESDEDAPEVGGCGDGPAVIDLAGPAVIDLAGKVYWYC